MTRWGTPHPGQGRVPPLARTGWGTAPPPPGQAMLGQVMTWTLRLLQFPAGGLSCYNHDSSNAMAKRCVIQWIEQ